MKRLLVVFLALGLVACEDSAQEKLAKIELEKKPLSDKIGEKQVCEREALAKKDFAAANKCQADLDQWRKENNK
jgi:hypothetical protein